MNYYLFIAGSLALILGVIHSVLGESLIFRRLHASHLDKSTKTPFLSERHVRTLRATWHLISLFGWGFAAILIGLSWLDSSINHLGFIKGVMIVMFSISSLYWFIGTRGKHPAWVVFITIAILVWQT